MLTIHPTYSGKLRRNSAMSLSEKELLERDAQRDIGAELLQAIRGM